MTINKKTIYSAIPIAFSAGIGTAVAIFSDVIQKKDASTVMSAINIFKDLVPIDYMGLYVLLFFITTGMSLAIIMQMPTTKDAFAVGVASLSIIFTMSPYNATPSIPTQQFLNPGMLEGSTPGMEINSLDFYGSMMYEPRDADPKVKVWRMYTNGALIMRDKETKRQIKLAPGTNIEISMLDPKTKKPIASTKVTEPYIVFGNSKAGSGYTIKPGLRIVSITIPGYKTEEAVLDVVPTKNKELFTILNIDMELSILPTGIQKLMKK